VGKGGAVSLPRGHRKGTRGGLTLATTKVGAALAHRGGSALTEGDEGEAQPRGGSQG
jgi:hypothetical protein